MIVSLAAVGDVPVWLIAPFLLLLLLIAIMPLAPARLKHAWECCYPGVSLGFAVLVAAYYFALVPNGARVVAHTVHEYFSFVALIGSLFVVAGGIHLKVKGEATPAVNVVFLFAGAVIANVIGTTGAAMVLIRPWIRMNKIRIGEYHIVFFIFLVANIGGALTPIGDPPLFLGYLRGVPFFWLLRHAVPAWAFTIALVLAVFYVFDRRSFRRMPRPLQREVESEGETWRFDGKRNLGFMAVVVGAVFLPERYFAREVVMLAAAFGSHRFTPKFIHEENAFSFGPVREVAWLFAGIFVTMMPALAYLETHGPALGIRRPLEYYFGAGTLSAVLDNAPTYLNFLQLAQATVATPASGGAAAEGVTPIQPLLEHQPALVLAISLGAVFFGAMTYIGNGPNFMVKAIAHHAGVRCPSFFDYVLRFSLPLLLPILALAGWIFL